MTSIAIAGGGIAGLSIAHAIRQRDPRARVVVLEQSARPGGNVRTDVIDGYTCEAGPDGFLDNAPDTLRLVSDLGLQTQLRVSNDVARRRFIFRNGRLHEVPTSPMAFLTTRLLSMTAKARIVGEPFAADRPHADETIYGFAARRIGTEAATAMIDPMVSGIFAGNAHALSLRACFPKMWDMETEHGSLFKALVATRRRRKKGDAIGAPAGRLTSFDRGMEVLIRRLADSLGSALRTSAGVIGLRDRIGNDDYREANRPGYTVTTFGGAVDADAVVLTGPASVSADLIRPFDATLAGLLAGIATAPLAVVCLGYDDRAVAAERGPLNGFGFLVPRSERIRILGALWETSIYPDRAPAGKALIRVMIGGALDREVISLDDVELIRIVRQDLQRTMRLRLAPEFTRIVRHTRGIPQYTVGHTTRLQRIDALLQAHPGLFLAGNSYRGVSINSCIAEAGGIADRVLAYVNGLAQRERRSEFAVSC